MAKGLDGTFLRLIIKSNPFPQGVFFSCPRRLEQQSFKPPKTTAITALQHNLGVGRRRVFLASLADGIYITFNEKNTN